MEFEFFKPKETSTTEKGPIEQPKEEPKKSGILNKSTAAAAFGVLSVLPNISNAEGVNKDANVNAVNPITRHAEAPTDVHKKAGNFSMTDHESNETKEKAANLEMAKEAILHAGKGGYTSDKMPGFVLISEKGSAYHGGSLSYDMSYQIKAYKVSEGLMNGYFIYDIGVDGDEKKSDEDIAKNLNEVGTQVSSRLNPTDPIDISFVYNRLREKMNPTDIQKLLETVNKGLNVDMLIAALESNTNYDSSEKKQIGADILTLRQSPTKTINDRELNKQNLADAGK